MKGTYKRTTSEAQIPRYYIAPGISSYNVLAKHPMLHGTVYISSYSRPDVFQTGKSNQAVL